MEIRLGSPWGVFIFGCGAGGRFQALTDEIKSHANPKNQDAGRLPGGKEPPLLSGIVIPPEMLIERPQKGIGQQVNGKNLSIKTFASIEPGQRSKKDEIEGRFINLGGVNRMRMGRMIARKGNRPG